MIQVVTYAGIAVHGVTVNGNGQQPNITGNRVAIDASANDEILLDVQRPGCDRGNVHFGPLPDADRQRGWRRLASAAPGVLAYGLEDDRIVILPRAGQDWMGGLPDDRALADLCVPGTHESASLSGGECGEVPQGVNMADSRLHLAVPVGRRQSAVGGWRALHRHPSQVGWQRAQE